jgi:hypothetical protein
VRNFAAKFVIEYSMKRLLRPYCVLLFGALILSSCLGSDEDSTTTYNDMAIKTFKLGTLKRYVHKTLSTGKDTVYLTTYSAATYKMNIDQLNHRIFNTDSLLTGTDMKHIICTATTVNNGVVYIKSLTSDSLRYFSSGSDSIDFSQPRVFRVFATDGSGSRDYTVSLTVRNQDPGVFLWQVADKAGFPQTTDDEMRQAAERAGLIYLGKSSYEAYAINSEGMLMESEDEGATWTADKLDTDASLLPKNALSYAAWILDYKTDYALLAGQNPASDKAMVLWRKLVDDDGDGRWVYMPLADDNNYYLPKMDYVVLVPYANSVLAFGNNKKIYQSRDQGITWKTTAAIQYPDGFNATSSYKVAVDNEDVLWLMDTVSGQTWKGRLTE